MRFFVMFVTAVCVLFLIKLRWPKKKNFYDNVYGNLKFRLNYGTNYNAGLKQDFDVRVGSKLGFEFRIINRVGNIVDFGHK